MYSGYGRSLWGRKKTNKTLVIIQKRKHVVGEVMEVLVVPLPRHKDIEIVIEEYQGYMNSTYDVENECSVAKRDRNYEELIQTDP